MDPTSEFELLKEFCVKHNISCKGVLAITFQRNRTTEWCSYIVNFSSNRLENVYPAELITDYKEGRKGDILFTYQENLDVSKLSKVEDTPTERPFGSSPFCCDHIQPYRNRTLERERLFTDFLQMKGDHPNIVYEVKEQVNFGPLISTRYFLLLHDRYEEKQYQKPPHQKIHAFKNFKCSVHNRFFGIDLFQEPGTESGYNRHHMRVNAFARPNAALLRELMEKK